MKKLLILSILIMSSLAQAGSDAGEYETANLICSYNYNYTGTGGRSCVAKAVVAAAVVQKKLAEVQLKLAERELARQDALELVAAKSKKKK